MVVGMRSTVQRHLFEKADGQMFKFAAADSPMSGANAKSERACKVRGGVPLRPRSQHCTSRILSLLSRHNALI
ncbi:hypothetical protein CBOM_05691 [Ceraceosorus bombacis]|uniref:Uncharacterized protein n=1 Tax=Ceraceosorus bombacis TaxID=401625 RepID=A0A0P1BSS8_9BASI|nr:hypothetical protein CBOM_05691 [Ceraceosorus bombacis]